MRASTIFFSFVACLAFLPCLVAQQDSWYQQLSPCAMECANTTFHGVSHCDQLNNVSCICTDAAFIPSMTNCLATSCTRKEIFSAFNVTSVACGAPTHDRAPMFRYVMTSLFVVSTIAIIIRFAARFAYGERQWLLDGCMGLVLILHILFFVVSWISTYHGLGKDIWKVPFDQITKLMIWDWVGEMTYTPLIGLVRTYFLLFFLSVFPDKRFKRVAWGMIIFNLLYTTAFFLPSIFTCKPMNVLWLGWDGEHPGKCQDSMARALSHGAISILCDFITLALPIQPIWKLQMDRKKKIEIMLIFCVGALVTIISIVRLKFLLSFRTTTNPTWDLLNPTMWSLIEIEVAIICACLPALRMAVNRISSPASRSSTSDSSHSYIKKSFSVGQSIESRKSTFSRHSRNGSDGDFVNLVKVEGNASLRKEELGA